MNDIGYIKIWRQVADWRWWSDDAVFRIFIGLIILANYKDGEFKIKTVKRGSFITSLDNLCAFFQCSKSKIRRCLKCLCETGEITEEPNNHYRLITITNYDCYQDDVKNLPGQCRDPNRYPNRDSNRDSNRYPIKEDKKYSSSSYRKKKNTRKKNSDVPEHPEQKKPVSFWEFSELAEKCADNDPFSCNEFYSAFKASGTALPENTAEIYERYLNAAKEQRKQFADELMSGKYKEVWGECGYDT